MLDHGRFSKQGYDWWWHNFTAVNEQTGEEKPFFIEYFTCNPKIKNQLNNDLPILGQLPENKKSGIKPSYVMIKAGWWGKDATQLHRFISWNNSKIECNKKTGYLLTAENCSASETHLKGSITISENESKNHPEWMCDSGTIEWDIKIEKKVAFNVGYGAGKLFRWLQAFDMFWHAEGMKSFYSGTIVANGKKYIVKPETSYGYADKNWGSDFTSPWVWLSSCDLTSKISGKKLQNSVFDIGGGRPVVFKIPLNRKLLSDFWYEGKSYEFNFSKFWTFTRTKFSGTETDTQIVWYVRQETKKYVMETNVTCEKSDMLLVNYEAPNGSKRHNKLWNGGNGKGTVKLFIKKHGNLELIDEIEAKHIGCEYGEYC